MIFNYPIKDLNELGMRFQRWKQHNPYRHVPKRYWEEALKFTTDHSLDDIATAIGCTRAYILYKQQKKQPITTRQIEFVEIQPCQAVPELNQIRMSIKNSQGILVELSFQSSLEQVFPLISSLLKEESSCSK